MDLELAETRLQIYPKCKTKSSRAAAFRLLVHLCNQQQANMDVFVSLWKEQLKHATKVSSRLRRRAREPGHERKN